MTRAELTAAMTRHLVDSARRAGVPLDRYDADFIVGAQMQWLQQERAALTGVGVKRIRTKETT